MPRLILTIILIICTTLVLSDASLVNKVVQRNIDLSSQLSKHSIDITLQNNGTEEVNKFIIPIQRHLVDKLAYLYVSSDSKQLKTALDDSEDQHLQIRVTLPEPLQPTATIEVNALLIFIHMMPPFPDQITQQDRQLVRYSDNVYYYTPYKTGTMRTKVKLASSSVQSHSEVSPTVLRNDVLTYGSYKEVDPFSVKEMTIHFENNKPFLTVKHVNRLIEVSHWGNIAVEEKYKIVHEGAKLKGSFSRYDFQINPTTYGQAAVQVLRQFLPSVAADVYYRDDIGNISTSFLRPGNPQQLDMRPRFPLFGGWQTDFTVGYNLPTTPFLGTSVSDSSLHVLNISFMASWEMNIAYDEQVLEVVLPEGAADIDVHVPFDVTITRSSLVTYLDVQSVGRPVMVIKKRNLVNEHNQHFQITYRFPTRSMFFEPFLLVSGFLSVFIAVIFLVRVNLNIVEDEPSNPEVESAILQLRPLYLERTSLLSKADEALKNYFKTNSAAQYEKDKKAVSSALLKAKKEAQKYLTSLSKLNESLANKLNEVETKFDNIETQFLSLSDVSIKANIQNQIKLKPEVQKLQQTYDQLKSEIEEEIENIIG